MVNQPWLSAFVLRIKRASVLFTVSSVLLLQACGGGGGAAPAPATQNVSGGGVKGPLANAIVTAYSFDPTQPGFKGSVAGTGTTDASAAITGLALSIPLDPPYILEFTSDAGTTDITTGQAPVISTLRTVLTQTLLDGGEQVYATPLTTMATDLAVQNADSNIAPYTGLNDGTVTEAEFLAALDVAAAQVVSTLGFGISSNVNIFDTPPLIDDTTDTTAEQSAVAAYRTAVEALTAMVAHLGQNIANPAVTAEEMLTALTNDLADGAIDGSTGGPIDAAVTTELETVDPATLPIPNTDDGTGNPLTPADVEQILVTEKTDTGSTTPTTDLEDGTINVTPAPAETNPSQDGDSIPDSSDNCPLTANEDQADANNNGVGNACEVAPVANDDSGSVAEGGTINGASILANDVDNQGDALSIALIVSPQYITGFSINADGTYNYTHDGGETTSDSFTYQVNDGALTSNTATVTITITPVDDPTVLTADTSSITENSVPDNVSGNVLANDTDPDTVLSVDNAAALNNTGTYGNLVIDGTGAYTYTLDNTNATVIALGNGQSLQDVYNYTANGTGSTLTITINGADDGTVLTIDTNSITEDGAATVSGNVLSNDIDPDTVLVVSNAAALNGSGSYGSLSIGGTGAYVYSLDNANTTVDVLGAGGSLTEVYSYTVNGGPTSTLTITINGADDVTVATADTASITEDAAPNTVSGNILSNDTDPDTTLTVSNAAALNGTGTYGSLSINGTGAYTYTLDNSNTTVDALLNGGSLSEVYNYNTNGQSSSLTITINGNDDVAALTVDTGSVTEDAAQNSVSGNVLTNDSDTDTALSVSNAAALNGTGSFGTLTIDGTGAYTYTVDNANASVNALNTGDTLSDVYNYSANGESSTLTITINGADDATVSNVDAASITEDAAQNTVSGNVLTNDSDPDTTLTVSNAGTLNGSGAYGSLSIDGTGAYTYTLDNSNATVDALLNGGSLSEVYNYNTNGQSSTLTITINGNDDPAILAVDTGSVTEDAAQDFVSGNVLTNDSDSDTALTVSNAAALNGTGTYGTLAINSTGAYTYTLNNANAAVNALNAGDTLSEVYNYSVNGLLSSLTITINGSTDGVAPNIQGVWKANVTVGPVNVIINDGSCDTTGDTWTSYLTVAQSGGAFTMTNNEGVVFNGNIDSAGNMTFTGLLNGSYPDLSSPTTTTVYTDSDTYTNGTAFATDTTITSGSVLDTYANQISGDKCETTLNFTANKVYIPTGSENYNGVFGMEEFGESLDNFGFYSSNRENYPLQFTVTGSTVSYHFIDEPGCTFTESNQTYDPATGAFGMDVVEICTDAVDNTSERSSYTATGIFVRAPGETTAASVSMILFGEQRFYDNVDWTLGTQTYVARKEDFLYGKLLPTVGHTRAIVVEQGTGSNQSRIHMGFLNPPTEVLTDTSMLYIEVLDGGTVLCSTPYIGPNNTGRYFEIAKLPVPSFEAEGFRTGAYSYANCNTSDANGVDRVFDNVSYTVRILDTGANGVNDGNTGDDSIILSQDVVAEITTDRYTSAITRGDLRLNGAKVSHTRSGRAIPAFGYFDFSENMIFSWPSHPENTGVNFEHYQLRITEVDDYIQQRIAVAGNQNAMLIPAGTMDNFGEYELHFKARKDDDLTSGIRSHAFSSRMKVVNGIKGLFNFDLDNNIPRGYQTAQISITGLPGGAPLSKCSVTNNSNMSCSGGSVDAGTDTVTLNMIDNAGNLVGAGLPFTLVLNFNPDGTGTSSGTATVTSFDVAGVGTNALTTLSRARAVHPELTVRSLRFSNGTEQSLAVLHNPIQVSSHDRAVFRVNDNSNFVVAGANTGGGIEEMYNNAGANTFGIERTIFRMLPADDLIVQKTGRFVSQRTSNDWGLGAGLLAVDRYKIVMQDNIGTADDIIFRSNYAADLPTAYVTPTLGQVEILTAGGTVACSTGVACDAANPVDVSADASTYDVRWTVSNSTPLTSRWRLVFRDNVGTNIEWRTNWIVPGAGMDITVVDNGDTTSTYTWTNPGDFFLNPGESRRIQIRVDNGGTQLPTVMGVSVTPHQANIAYPVL